MEEKKQRMIQEYVPGKQVTLAHIIANPHRDLSKKIGFSENNINAIGILTITPGEAAIIAADIATKNAEVEIGFVDRFSGTLITTGTVSQVEEGIRAVMEYCKEKLMFTICEITKT